MTNHQPFKMFFFVAVITIGAVFWRVSEASVVAKNISQSASAVIGTAADAAAVLDTWNSVCKPKTPKPRSRVRRSANSGSGGSFGKSVDAIEYFAFRPLFDLVGKGVHKLFPAFIPGDWGEIAVPAVRTDSLLLSHSIFSTLTRTLDKSFKDIKEKYKPDTGDVISCRMSGSSSFGEHYMMMFNETSIIEVGTPSGTKLKNNGSIQVIPIQDSNYYESNECLYHRNTILGIASLCDNLNEKDKPIKKYVEYNRKMGEIGERLRAMITPGKNFKGFGYRTLSCNCQDLVLYWAYGFVNNRDCIAQLFPEGTSIVKEHSLDDLKSYFDSHTQKCRTDTVSYLRAIHGVEDDLLYQL